MNNIEKLEECNNIIVEMDSMLVKEVYDKTKVVIETINYNGNYNMYYNNCKMIYYNHNREIKDFRVHFNYIKKDFDIEKIERSFEEAKNIINDFWEREHQ